MEPALANFRTHALNKVSCLKLHLAVRENKGNTADLQEALLIMLPLNGVWYIYMCAM